MLLNRSILLSLLLVPLGACGSDAPEEVDTQAILDELYAEARASLVRTQELSTALHEAWQQPDPRAALAALAVDPAAFSISVQAFLDALQLEQLPTMQGVESIAHVEGMLPAVMVQTGIGAVRISFDPTLDPAQLVTFEPQVVPAASADAIGPALPSVEAN